MLEAHGITVERSGRKLLDDVSVAIPPERVTAIVGPNGAGKSTLIKVLAGEIVPTHGDVLLDGRNLKSFRAAELAARRAIVPQSTFLSFPFSVIEVVKLGASVPGFDQNPEHSTPHRRGCPIRCRTDRLPGSPLFPALGRRASAGPCRPRPVPAQCRHTPPRPDGGASARRADVQPRPVASKPRAGRGPVAGRRGPRGGRRAARSQSCRRLGGRDRSPELRGNCRPGPAVGDLPGRPFVGRLRMPDPGQRSTSGGYALHAAAFPAARACGACRSGGSSPVPNIVP